MVIDKEMSKEKDSKNNPPNVVAKLMGLETLPISHIKDYSSQQWKVEESFLMDKEMLHEIHPSTQEICYNNYKDIYESDEDVDGRKMALIHQKFMEAKVMSTDKRLRESKQFEDALEVLSSNSDLLERLFDSQNFYELHSTSQSETTKHITLIKPLKMVDNEKTSRKGKNKNKKKKNDSLIKWENKNLKNSQESQKLFEFPVPTRIVVLKPSATKDLLSSTTSSPRNLPSRSFQQPLCSSFFNNGYFRDESSFNKSYHDLDAMSLFPRHSFDYISGCVSPYSTLSLDRFSCSPESSVCIEAKKRLSERWNMISSSNNQEQRHLMRRRRSSTLGEMLSLSHVKKSVTCEIEGVNNEDHEQSKVVSLSHSFNSEEIRFNNGSDKKNLPRSNSVPASSTVFENGIGLEIGDEKSHGSKMMMKKSSKSLKSSFKGKVASFFFSRNKKSASTKKKSKSKYESQANVIENSSGVVMDDESESFSIGGFEECYLGVTCESSGKTSTDSVTSRDQTLEPGNMTLPKDMVPPLPQISSENQDQPSPISVLESSFEDHSLNGSHVPLKSNLIDKSPHIESIARTLSWDDSCAQVSSPYPLKTLMVSSLETSMEEQEWLILVQKLLLAAGLFEHQGQNESFYTRWYSLESPLDPSLRDTFANMNNDKGPLHEGRRRKIRSNQKLVFDFVNSALMEFVGSYGLEKGFKKSSGRMLNGGAQAQEGALKCEIFLVDHIMAQMNKELIASGVREDCGDKNSLVMVEDVVRKEVVGIGWVQLLELEIDILEREIEGDLIQELVENVVLDLMDRA